MSCFLFLDPLFFQEKKWALEFNAVHLYAEVLQHDNVLRCADSDGSLGSHGSSRHSAAA